MSDPALANDKYRATLRSTFVDGVDTTLAVTAIPTNLPTIVVVGWDGTYETKFSVTSTSGTNSSNYALTGVVKISGYTGNIPENTAVNCLNNEDFFNQWGTLISDLQADVAIVSNTAWTTLSDASSIEIDLDDGVNKRFEVTTAGDRTFTVVNPLIGQVFTLRITNDGTQRTPVWFSGITWIGIEDDPDLADHLDASKTASLIFICTDAGTPTFDGYLAGVEE